MLREGGGEGGRTWRSRRVKQNKGIQLCSSSRVGERERVGVCECVIHHNRATTLVTYSPTHSLSQHHYNVGMCMMTRLSQNLNLKLSVSLSLSSCVVVFVWYHRHSPRGLLTVDPDMDACPPFPDPMSQGGSSLDPRQVSPHIMPSANVHTTTTISNPRSPLFPD